MPRDDAVEGRTSRLELGKRDLHTFEGLEVENVELASIVHQHLGEPDSNDERVHQQWEPSWLGNVV